MKNFLILALILIAGVTAYPQETRSAKKAKAKTEKGSVKEETKQRTVTGSESGSRRSARAERSKATTSKPETNRAETTRPKVETRSTERTPAVRSNRETTGRSQERTSSRINTSRQNDTGNAARRGDTGNTVRRSDSGTNRSSGQTRNTRQDDRPVSTTDNQRNIRESGRPEQGDGKIYTSSANRTFREGKGTLTKDDGSVIRHQNDEVFTSRRFRLDYDNYENLRRSDEFRREYRDYDAWNHRRAIRVVYSHHHNYIPLSWEIRRSRYYHRMPLHIDLIWTPLLFHRFMFYYPTHDTWEMEFGTPIETISAYEAQEYAGTVRRVYGKVDEVYYSPEDENYILYIGAPFPYQDMSVVIPRDIARNFSRNPKWYFENEFVWIVGLINIWEGKPEIIVRDEDQIRKY